MLAAIIVALIIVALVLAIVENARTQFQSLIAWAVISLSVALLIWRLA